MNRVLSKKSGMSFAEILITLGIIGIVAGISIPTIVNRIDEKAITAQKKAAITIMTEALSRMTGLSGYGDGNSANATNAFIAGALQKSVKIRTICNKDNLKECNLPDSFLNEDASSDMTFPKNMKDLYPIADGPDSDVAGFLTINGISIAAYYNPNCTRKEKHLDTDSNFNVKDKICLNMIYDVNGTKKPNRIGEDIGYITVLYSNEPEVVAPEPASTSSDSGAYQNICRNLDKAHQPTIEELAALYMNKKLSSLKGETGAFISNTNIDKDNILGLDFSSGEIKAVKANKSGKTRCVKDANKRN